MKFWYWFEKRIHLIDAYLAYNRGDMLSYGDFVSKADFCDLCLLKLRLNK